MHACMHAPCMHPKTDPKCQNKITKSSKNTFRNLQKINKTTKNNKKQQTGHTQQQKSGQNLDESVKNLFKNNRKISKNNKQNTKNNNKTADKQRTPAKKHKSSNNSTESIILSTLPFSIGTHVWVRSSRSERTDKHQKITKDHDKNITKGINNLRFPFFGSQVFCFCRFSPVFGLQKWSKRPPQSMHNFDAQCMRVHACTLHAPRTDQKCQKNNQKATKSNNKSAKNNKKAAKGSKKQQKSSKSITKNMKNSKTTTKSSKQQQQNTTSAQNLDRIWTKSGRNLDKICTDSGQNLHRIWTSCAILGALCCFSLLSDVILLLFC